MPTKTQESPTTGKNQGHIDPLEEALRLAEKRPIETSCIHPSCLPPALREIDLAGTVCDARHLAELIDGALDKVIVLQAHDPATRGDMERATALLWVARDLAGALEWKLDKLDAASGRAA